MQDPFLVEHYNSITGENISTEPDYNHSYYVDLVVRHLAGIEPDCCGVRFHPVDAGLRSLCMKDVRVRNHRFDVTMKDGVYTVDVDGEKVYEGTGMADVRLIKW